LTHVSTNFSPRENGFAFLNYFRLNIPVQIPMPFGGSVDLSKVVFGLCGGMCFSALDYYHLGEPPPPDTQVESIDPKLYVYLCQRQLDSLSVPVLFKVFEWMLNEDTTLAVRMSRYEMPKIYRSLEKGEPVVLALIRVKGLDDPSHNHQVLATSYDFDPVSKDLHIDLYDPNHPGEQPSLSLNLTKPSQGLHLTQSTGEPLRAFFVIPYQPSRAAPQMVSKPKEIAREVPEPPFRLGWPVDSLRVNQYFGENPETYKPFGLPGHEGLDLFATTGANVYAAADGDVYEAELRQGHPYGRQIRIKHSSNGKVFHTVYAHLSQTLVSKGQHVIAGELIGLADNTGNSFGSHLHLTLKIEGEQTPGYPAWIVDPWPYLKDSTAVPTENLPELSGVKVYTTAGLNLRTGPSTEAPILGAVPAGETLNVFGDADTVHESIGIEGQWLQILTASGQTGYVAAWYVQDVDQSFPPSDLVVYPDDLLNLRSGPGTAFNLLATLTQDDALTVLGDGDLARESIGRQGAWLQVETSAGARGFVAAWLVHVTGQAPPPSGLSVYPTIILNVHIHPSQDANILAVVTPKDRLSVLGDRLAAETRMGQTDQWLNVQTPSKFAGYVAAWLVTKEPPPK
jgi:murein DD-endopeptidase MepM/ murein hydrolase activator NlpD